MQTRPNIIWLTLDSVRTDRTSLGSADRGTTPQMKRIASLPGGQAFSECVAHAMWSLPSDASILTGTYPSFHGTGLWNEVLPGDITTVPERFSALGYHTAAVSQNAYCSESTGLSRGFDRFDSVETSNLVDSVGVRTLVKYALNLRRHSGGYTLSRDRHRSDFLALDLLKRRLDSFQGRREPFFMFVHTLGAHLPYAPPLPFRREFAAEVDLPASEAVERAIDVSSNHYRSTAGGCEFPPATRAAVDAMYDALVAYTDWYVGRFFEFVRSLDLGPTVFVVTADHGDLLGEHGVMGHQLSLHDGVVNVPMVVHGLPSLTDVADDALVQHVDVMQALLATAGASADALEGMQGIDPRAESRSYAISQRGNDTYETAVEQIRGHEPAADIDRFHPGLVHAVRDRRFKLLRSDRGEELYRLPDEETDVSAAYPSVVRGANGFLDDALDRIGERQSTDDRREMSEAMKRQLADLGYITD
jgi:uncharacterized sulfatase